MTPAPSEVVLLSTVRVSVPSTEEAVEEEAVTGGLDVGQIDISDGEGAGIGE